MKFDDKYLDFTGLPWHIILSISIISLINEFHKYIVIFDFVTFLGFRKKFVSRFKKFTNFISLFIKMTSIFHLLLIVLKNLFAFMSLHKEEFGGYY